MNRYWAILITFMVGFGVGFQWNESRYSQAKLKLLELADADIDDYLKLKKMEEKYAKADEILGKALLIFFADLGLRLSNDKMAFARNALQPKPIPVPVFDAKGENKVQDTLPLQLPTPPKIQAPTVSHLSPLPTPPLFLNAHSGNILGRVKFSGTVPPLQPIKMNADPVCVRENSGKPVFNDEISINPENGLANVFVSIKEGLNKNFPPAPEEPVILDQRGCRYSPHVIGVRVGQTLKIMNSDPTLHNVNVIKHFNKGMPVKGSVTEHRFKKPEQMISVKCDVHGWMRSYIGVMEHPYFAVSDSNGTFSIHAPPGNYVIEAWHEKLGIRSLKVNVGTTPKFIEFTY